MRKLKLQVQMSVDGYIAGPNGEMDFMVWNWDEELKSYVAAITAPVDCIVLGRKLAEGFIPYWADVAADDTNPEQAAGRKFTDTPKVVFSGSLDQSQWDNTVVAGGDLVEEVTKLKNQPGQDIIAYGGATFVADLIRHDLIDEYHLLINPGAIGKGLPIFTEKTPLELVKATQFECGIVALQYTPVRQ